MWSIYFLALRQVHTGDTPLTQTKPPTITGKHVYVSTQHGQLYSVVICTGNIFTPHLLVSLLYSKEVIFWMNYAETLFLILDIFLCYGAWLKIYLYTSNNYVPLRVQYNAKNCRNEVSAYDTKHTIYANFYEGLLIMEVFYSAGIPGTRNRAWPPQILTGRPAW